MRLTCPNCNAIYEVDENVIPVGGRDVQCSNCGQSWFQQGADAAPDRAPADDDQQPVDTAPEPASIPAPPSDAAPDGDDKDSDGDDFSGDFISPKAADAGRNDPITAATIAAARAGKEQQRRTLDDSLLAVLREEAEIETRARKAEGSTLETQPELGLERAPAPVAIRPSQINPKVCLPEDPNTEPEPDPTPQRRQLLPDIEVINSTLVATSDRGAEPASRDAPETLARRRAGFQTGFLLAVLIAVFGFGVYLLAPRISTALPAAEPALTAYVAQVDHGRIWLDDKMREMTEAMQRTPEN
ncbi:zinc-ribbon domain-containing protein [Phaeovulum sp.]|uniref:zinc-ribbon domain-containing protein n=1 Tax=Phaeovulum sp. TaxID=2934796 RepID=UPI0039E5B0CE